MVEGRDAQARNWAVGSRNSGAQAGADGQRDCMGAGDSRTRGLRQQHVFRSGQRKAGVWRLQKGKRNQGFGKS